MNKETANTEAAREHTKSERVYRSLRRRIREFELPPGSRLRKNEIALEYGVSRAPVSEAISRLADEGLVDVFPQSGSFVSPIRPEDIRESLLIRTALEVEAVRRVTAMADEALLRRLDENLQAQDAAIENEDMALLDDLDEAFHAIIISAIHAPRARHLLDTARALLDRPRFHALPEANRPKDTVSEHRRIADAIRTGDVEFAATAMRVHLNMVSRAIETDLTLLEVNDAKESSRDR